MKPNKETIIRTVVLSFALINQVLNVFGINPLPFSNEEVFEAVSVVFTVGASVAAWWKNNSFTKAAIRADAYMNKLKER